MTGQLRDSFLPFRLEVITRPDQNRNVDQGQLAVRGHIGDGPRLELEAELGGIRGLIMERRELEFFRAVRDSSRAQGGERQQQRTEEHELEWLHGAGAFSSCSRCCTSFFCACRKGFIDVSTLLSACSILPREVCSFCGSFSCLSREAIARICDFCSSLKPARSGRLSASV